MIGTFFKIALRSFGKNKLGTFINLVGFSIGLAASMLILTYVRHEFSFDSFHNNAARIYRINVSMNINDSKKIGTITPNILGPKLKEEVPQVESYFRMLSSFNKINTIIINEKRLEEERFFHADSTIFDIFKFQFLAGRQDGLFQKKEDAIISTNTAIKYFGSTEILGETFETLNGNNYVIRGVFEDFPSNSHMHPNLIASSLSSKICSDPTWDGINYLTFLLLDSESSVEIVESNMDRIVEENLPESFKAIETEYNLMALQDIHLRSEADFELEPSTNIKQLYAYLAIAAFILIIACVNYVNLATSRALDRAKEVGLKKMAGAQRFELILQFVIEAYLLTFFSLVLAVGLFELFKPVFSSIVGKQIQLSIIGNFSDIRLLISGWAGLTLMAALYPSMILSSFKPFQILKGNFKHSKSGNIVRKSMVVFQFVISSTLIVGTLVVYNQITYMKTKHLGFAKDQLLIFTLDRMPEQSSLDGLKKQLNQHSNIQNVSFASAYPGRTSNGKLINAEGMAEDEQLLVWNWRVERDYLATMDIKLLLGKNFNDYIANRENCEFIINETAMRDFNWSMEDAIGKRLTMGMQKGVCVGVIKDFHFSSLQFSVEPIVMHCEANNLNNIMVRLGNGDIGNTLEYIENEWAGQLPNSIFSYNFLDQKFDQLYDREHRTAEAFSIFSLLSIFIASLGLFGLSTYETISRTKEIGIRKSLGSSNIRVFGLLVKNFSKLAILAFLLSIPIAYYFMNNWLENFEFRTNISWSVYVISAGITFVIVLISIGYHSLKAARTNPVDSLRYE